MSNNHVFLLSILRNSTPLRLISVCIIQISSVRLGSMQYRTHTRTHPNKCTNTRMHESTQDWLSTHNCSKDKTNLEQTCFPWLNTDVECRLEVQNAQIYRMKKTFPAGTTSIEIERPFRFRFTFD